MASARRSEREGGFVLAMVVMFLFAIAVASATGYLVVGSEFAMSNASRDGNEALAVARAGLHRFSSEQLGVVGDSVSYAIGDGIAQVTSRRVFVQDSLNHLYYLRSEGTVTNARYPGIPARRVVSGYAWHRRNPIPLNAAVWVSGGELRLEASTSIDGADHATLADCAGGATVGVTGIATAGTVVTSGGTYAGNPALDASYASYSDLYNAARIRWDVLSSASFPVDFEGSPPNFAALPADSFPVVRYSGNLTAHYWWNGRGVLIVTGRFRPGYQFEWDGIILAGELDRVRNWYQPQVRGMLIAGLNAANPNERIQSGSFDYHSCNVYSANASLSYLEIVDGSIFEVG
jgi:hypothetical protein